MPKGSKMLKPVKVHIVIGKPLPAPEVGDGKVGTRMPRRVIHELTEALQVEVQRLFDEAQAKVSGQES